MGHILDAIADIKASLPSHVELIAISKTHPKEYIEEAYSGGQRHFGENKVQELSAKHDALPKDIKWHMIGHLQSNKVKYIAPFVHLIHSIDSIKLLEVIDREAAKNDRVIDCLLQVHVAQEESKFGLKPSELDDFMQNPELTKMHNIRLCGLMAMASNTDDEKQVEAEFHAVGELFKQLKTKYFANSDHFAHISMGMSGDYELAIAQGATMIRIGSTIFGHRNYNL